jgi:hypothetical protein
MKRKRGLEMKKLMIFAILIVLSGTVSADSFRCGRAIVKAGDSTNVLLKRCGEPTRKYPSKEVIDDNGRQLRTGVSNWVYTRKGKKDMVVSVYSGNVAKMRTE